MTRFLVLLCLCGWLLASACAKSKAITNEKTLEISLSTFCGWCAPGDSLQLNYQTTNYRNFPSSCNLTVSELEQENTNQADWKELVSLLDLEKFRAIDLNICNICADGCDLRATVKQGNLIHSISYGSVQNDAVASVRPFLEKLEAIRQTHKQTSP